MRVTMQPCPMEKAAMMVNDNAASAVFCGKT